MEKLIFPPVSDCVRRRETLLCFHEPIPYEVFINAVVTEVQRMTHQDDTPTQIYVPAFRRELVACDLPETVLFLDPGLPQTAKTHSLFLPRTYPFSRSEAARVLDELLSTGESLGLANPAGKSAVRDVIHAGGMLSEAEEDAIDRFASAMPRTKNGSGNKTDITAYKILLLAWDLEGRLAEVASLCRQVAEAAKPLAESLHGPDRDERIPGELVQGLSEALSASLTDLPAPLQPDWRLSLAGMAPFLPENAVCVTCHSGLRDALMEGGMLEPLPERMARNLPGWTDAALSRMQRAKAPLWKILGRPREPENASYLLVAPDIVVCPEDWRQGDCL